MRDMERTFLYGEPYEDVATKDTTTASVRRVTGGIDYFISTNSTAVGGILTEFDFEAFLRSLFRYGSTERYLFCAPLIVSVISQWAQGKLQMYPKDKTYGRLYAVVKSNYMTGNSHNSHITNEVKIYGKRQSAGKRHWLVSWNI